MGKRCGRAVVPEIWVVPKPACIRIDFTPPDDAAISRWRPRSSDGGLVMATASAKHNENFACDSRHRQKIRRNELSRNLWETKPGHQAEMSLRRPFPQAKATVQ